MKHNIFLKLLISFLTISLILILVSCHSSTNEKKIGIIIPIEHQAMNEIVAGFTESLKKQFHKPIHIKVANGQVDLNLERAIMQQLKSENFDLIVPIGTSLTQMSLTTVRKQPILSLASSITQNDRENQKACHIAVVHDEIAPEKIIKFIHQIYPHMKHLVLLHSTDDKIFAEITAITNAGNQVDIKIKPLMVPTFAELYSIATNLPNDTDGILVLKDHLIVSGISTFASIATKRHIPLIASDQGSVANGADLALGVHERDIGITGGKLAAEILSGKPACRLPITELTTLTVFVNQSSLMKLNQTISAIKHTAELSHYTIEYLTGKNHE